MVQAAISVPDAHNLAGAMSCILRQQLHTAAQAANKHQQANQQPAHLHEAVAPLATVPGAVGPAVGAPAVLEARVPGALVRAAIRPGVAALALRLRVVVGVGGWVGRREGSGGAGGGMQRHMRLHAEALFAV